MSIINNSEQAYKLLRHLGRLEVEEFWILALHSNKKLMGMERVFRGTVDACPVHPRDVFRSACRWNAANLIVAHNHPSGACQPSREDLMITHRLTAGGKLLGIPLVDHLIVTVQGYWSFSDHGYDFSRAQYFIEKPKGETPEPKKDRGLCARESLEAGR